MTAEQIQKARATHWRQNQDPILTLEDAQSWLGKIGLCLFLPRRPQIAAPAPSFVEACLGAAHATPGREAIETAADLLRRLCDAGSAIPLNLLGTPGEQPDFVSTPETLPYIFALRGEKDWKREPHIHGAGKVSPLVLEVWRQLEQKGAQSAGDIKDALGREVTEAAVLRALHELWEHLRVIPMPQADGEAAVWQPVSVRFRKALNDGGNMSQVTALSVLTASYLESSIAATSEDAEAFLSPLASRSRVREVIRGLTATRQLSLLPMDAQTLIYVEGTLPEFEAIPEPAEAAPFEARRAPGRKPVDRAAAPFRPREAAGSRSDRTAGAREDRAPRPPARGGGRPAWKRPAAGETGERPRWKAGEKPPFEKRASARPPFAKRAGSEGGERTRGGETSRFGSGEKRPWQKRGESGGESRPFRKSPGTFRPNREGGKEAGERPRSGGPPRFGGAEKRPWQKRAGDAGQGKPFRKAPGTFRPDRERKDGAGERRAPQGGFAPPRRQGGPRFERREGAADRPRFDRRTGGAEKPRFERREGSTDRPRFERREGGPERPRTDRPRSFGDKARSTGQRFGERSERPRRESQPGDAGRRSFRERPSGPKKFGGPRFSKFGKPAASGSERPGEKPEGGPRKPFGGRPGAKFGSKPGAKFGPKPGAKFGPKPGAKFGSKPGAKFGAKPGGFRGKPDAKFGGKPGGKFSSKAGSRFGSKPGGKPGAKPAWKSGKPPRRKDTDTGASAE